MRKIISAMLLITMMLSAVCPVVSAAKVHLNMSFDDTEELVSECIYDSFYIEDGMLCGDSRADTIQTIHYIDDNGCFLDAGNVWLTYDAKITLSIEDDEFSEADRFISLVYSNDNPVYAGKDTDRSYISFIYDVDEGCFFLNEGRNRTDDDGKIMDPVYVDIDTDGEEFFDLGISIGRDRIRCFYNDRMIFDFKDTGNEYLIGHDVPAPFVFCQGGNCIKSTGVIISEKGYLYPFSDEDVLLDIEGFYLKPVSTECSDDKLVFDLCINDVNECGVYGVGLILDYSENLSLSSVKKLYTKEGLYTFSETTKVKPYTILWACGTAHLPYGETALVRLTFDVKGSIDEGIKVGLVYEPDNVPNGPTGDLFSENDIPVMGYMVYSEKQIKKIFGGVHKMIRYSSKAVSCEEDGWVINMCENCYYITKTVIPAHGHDIYTTSKKPSCTKEGWRSERCYYCDMNNRVVIPATGHTTTSYSGKAPSCTEPGYAAYETCNNCSYTSYKVLPAMGHDIVNYEEKAATCMLPGYSAYVSCRNCDFTTYKATPATGHAIVKHDGKAPTCTEAGYAAYETCENCDHTTYKVIDATGHTIVKHDGKAPTCTESGYAAYETCENCDHTTYKVIDATGHAIVKHDGKAPTCTEAGYASYETCENCDHTTYGEDTVIPALGHDTKYNAGKKPTCTEMGWEASNACIRCGYGATVMIPATGHTIVKHDGKAPTCTEAGYASYETCENCDHTTYKVIDATGHTIVKHDGKAPTCTEAGYAAYETCENCDHTTFAEISATGKHIGGVANCISKAVCDVCGSEYGEFDHDAHGETEIRGAVDVTDDADGYTGDKCCKDCGTILEAGEIIPKPDKVSGDTSGDGKVTLTDASMILKYIAKWEMTMDASVADVNGDGKVTLTDVSMILKYIAKWDVVLK
ncbi:MAG: hypothetical protein E7578_02285 [Ruminococcaceae bacterium]|nr:hypothetical protein [Oscillospiraceae bacterium]